MAGDRRRWSRRRIRPRLAALAVAPALVVTVILAVVVARTDGRGSAGFVRATVTSTSTAPTTSTTRPGPSPATGEPVTTGIAAPPVPEPADPVAEPTTTAAVPLIDLNVPPVVARDIPPEMTTPPFSFVSPWADATTTTASGATAVRLGCAAGTDAGALDQFFAERLGPLLGEDYQHVYPLGGGRYLWLFQDAFVDHTGLATRLDEGAFVHNIAMVQAGACFTLIHGGTINRPASFETGNGEARLSRWFWPMGGELTAQGLQVFWVEMAKDGYEPGPGDGLGWHPTATWLATYDPVSMTRRSFVAAADPGVSPIYGYAVASDETYTYLFANSFEQNLVREGGWATGPHSATAVYLARVPKGQLAQAPEYRTTDGWSVAATAAVSVSSKYWVENPMQPRFLDGVWVATTKVDGYWGDRLTVVVANDPWGPWQKVLDRRLAARGNDPLMNTYHAHLLPWTDAQGNLLVAVSENARDMVADAFPVPSRYRPSVIPLPWATPPPRPETTTTTGPTTPIPTTTLTSSTVTSVSPTTSAVEPPTVTGLGASTTVPVTSPATSVTTPATTIGTTSASTNAPTTAVTTTLTTTTLTTATTTPTTTTAGGPGGSTTSTSSTTAVSNGSPAAPPVLTSRPG